MVRLPEASNKCPARKFSALPHGRADFYKAKNSVFRLIKIAPQYRTAAKKKFVASNPLQA